MSDAAPLEATAERGPTSDDRPEAHVLVVDDDARIRDLIKRFLLRAGYRISAARDAAQARKLLDAFAFDLMIADVMMPGEDGFALTRSVSGRTPVLLLTAMGDTESRIVGLEAGADDYLPKPFEPRELILRIEAILRRAYRPPTRAAAERVPLGDGAYFDIDRGEFWRDGDEVRLTTAEITLMRMMAKRPNEPISRSEMLTELGPGDGDDGASDAVQERAVDVQITRLRKKVEPAPKSPRFIKTVRGAGYMLTPSV